MNPPAVPRTEPRRIRLARRAAAALQRGDHAAAKRDCRRILDEAPEDFNALQLLGATLRHEGRIEDAIGYLRRALAVAGPADATAPVQRLLAELLRIAGRDDEALSLLDDLLAANFADIAALVDKGLIHTVRGELQTALECFKQATMFPAVLAERVPEKRAIAFQQVMRSPLLPPLDDDIRRLREEIARCSHPGARITLRFSLGEGLERLGRYEEAMQA